MYACSFAFASLAGRLASWRAPAHFKDCQLSWRADGRVLDVVAQAGNGELSGALERMGGREVAIENLSLEEILVACLRQGGRSEVNHV